MNETLKMSMLIKAFITKKELSPEELQKALGGCGRHTTYRTLERAKSEFNIPIEYNRNRRVYRFMENGEKISLPLIWFTPKDVMVLLTLLETFRELPFGIIEPEISPFRENLKRIQNNNQANLNELIGKIKILPSHFRRTPGEMFKEVCSALLAGKRIKIKYKDRQNEKVTERIISPIQLVRYRDNWYLDAFCHQANQLRIFSVDRIESVEIQNKKIKKVSQKTLTQFYKESYGIFAGKPTKKALLKFTPQISRWVASEEWHPKQKAYFDKKGFYILQFPYSDERELVLDILRYGDDVEVKEPIELRRKIKQKLQNALKKYSR